MYELIVTEKPQAASKIADALADYKPIKENFQGVPFYKITHNKKDIVVGCAVGHLFGLEQKTGKKGEFPVFDIDWAPSHESKRESAFTKKYLNALKHLSKDAKEFTVATDYDIEGEVIGLNVVRYICKRKDANRMKFSTLTKPDLVEAYENKSPHLDWGQAKAGETRHKMDWFHGINYSRALTSAVKTTGSFKLMSTGRVQGPALKIIVDREKEIRDFKPIPFWQLQLLGNVNKGDIEAWHQKDKFWEQKEADAIFLKVRSEKQGVVSDIEKSQFKQSPPVPFDLTTLQTEAYRCFGIQPKDTLAIAQDLYTSGFISYPRTSSQILDPKIGFSKIFSLLARNQAYASLCGELLKGRLEPNNGKKIDPAHPAIYPTGLQPDLDSRNGKIYDIIVKRFMAVFGEPAVRETITMSIDVRKEIFIAKGTRTIERGWHRFYAPYVSLEELELPKVERGNSVLIKKINLLAKETQPPKRYTPASIIRELEKRNLGTKATRASIVDTLFQRGYVHGQTIQATELGIRTIDTLSEYVPEIVDEQLTRHFEDEMDEIRENKKSPDDVLEEVKAEITKISKNFKSKAKDIGKKLLSAQIETRDAMTTLGPCPTCKEGNLQLRRGKFGAFAACNKYPECKTTFSLPANTMIVPSGKICETCNHPMVKKIMKKKQPQDFCLNPECKSKYLEGEAGKTAMAIAKGHMEKKCSKCNTGNMVLRKSIYGTFLGCSNYPKCRNIEKLENKNFQAK